MNDHRARTVLVYLGMVGMEALWITAVFAVLVHRIAPHASGTVAAVTMGSIALPMGVAIGLERRKVSLRSRQAVSFGGLALFVLLVLALHVYRPPFPDPRPTEGILATAVCALIWWRGTSLGQVDLGVPNVVLFNFWVGLIMLLLLLLLAPVMAPVAAGPVVDLEGIDWLLPAFFFVGLTTLGLARLEEVGRMLQSAPVRFGGGRWILVTAGLAALMVLTGMAIAPFVAGGGLARAVAWTWPAVSVATRVVGGLLLALALLIWTLLMPLAVWLTNALHLSGLLEAMESVGQTLESLSDTLNEMIPVGTPSADLAQTVRVGFLVFVAAAVVIGVVRSTRLSRRRRVTWWAEERSLAEAWRGSRPSFLERVRRQAGKVRVPQLLAAASIRRIYANLTRLAARRGFPRRPAQTPNEYLPRLYDALPGCAEEVRTITQAYILAHYGQVPDTQQALQEIRQAWRQVREAAK